MSSSAHSYNIGTVGPTGAAGGATILKGHTGPTGTVGNVGLSGPTGSRGATVTGVTYSSTGPNAHHLVVEYGNGLTTDGGFFRGPTGSSIYYLFGENIGNPSATSGVFYHKTEDGQMYLKSLTGGGGIDVREEDGKIRIRYKTHNAVQAHGATGQLVFFNENSAGITGLSGATLTNYQAGPTYSISTTTSFHREVSGKIAPCKFDCCANTFHYNIDPIKLGDIDSARNNTSLGNYWMINAYDDYVNEFGGPPSTAQMPFIKINDCSKRVDVFRQEEVGVVDMYIVLDRSGSMVKPIDISCCDDCSEDANIHCRNGKFNLAGSCSDDCVSRLDSMKNSVVDLINSHIRSDTQLGLMSFSENIPPPSATHDVYLTFDHSLVKTEVNSMVADGGTDFTSSFKLLVDQFLPLSNRREHAKPVVVFLSDGDDDQWEDALPYRQTLIDAGVDIYTIKFASGDDSESLEALASDPSMYYQADTQDALTDVYKDIYNLYLDSSEDLIDPNTSRGFTLVIDPRITGAGRKSTPRIDCCSDGSTLIQQPVGDMYPSNWKFPYNVKANVPIWANFITLGDIDIDTGRMEWYGMVTRLPESPPGIPVAKSPFGSNQPSSPYSD
jgi:hypothetical protein